MEARFAEHFLYDYYHHHQFCFCLIDCESERLVCQPSFWFDAVIANAFMAFYDCWITVDGSDWCLPDSPD